jgi:hypothetical protein
MNHILKWLIPLIFILALTASLCGLFLPGGEGPFAFTTLRGHEVEMFGRGLYQFDTLLVDVPISVVALVIFPAMSLAGVVMTFILLKYVRT